jgi:sugar phosphate permease
MPEDADGSSYRWVILIVGTLVVFAALGLARCGYTIVLPAMQDGLGMDNTQAGVLATANLIGYLALPVIGGALASRFGPRAVITVGLAPAALGFITLFFGIGHAIGPTVAGVVADAAHSFVPPMVLAAGVALLGAVGAAVLRPVVSGGDSA